jgi:hypothetical protein
MSVWVLSVWLAGVQLDPHPVFSTLALCAKYGEMVTGPSSGASQPAYYHCEHRQPDRFEVLP